MDNQLKEAAMLAMRVLSPEVVDVRYDGNFSRSGQLFIVEGKQYRQRIYLGDDRFYETNNEDEEARIRAIAAYVVMEAKAYRSAMLDVMQSEIGSE